MSRYQFRDSTPREVDEQIVADQLLLQQKTFEYERVVQSLITSYPREGLQGLVRVFEPAGERRGREIPRGENRIIPWEVMSRTAGGLTGKELLDAMFQVPSSNGVLTAEGWKKVQHFGLSPDGIADWCHFVPADSDLYPFAQRAIAIRGEMAEIKERREEANREFVRRGGWSRYYLVVSSVGHIHSDTMCRTCNNGRRPTQFALFAVLSGQDSVRAVDVFGPALCSVCFPDAPLEWLDGTKIKQSLVTAYVEGGYDGWLEAVAKAERRATTPPTD